MIEQSENERVERILRETLQAEPKRRVSPFFAARVSHVAASSREDGRRRSRFMTIYWIVFAVASIAALAPLFGSTAGRIIALLLVPAGFAFALYGREVLAFLIRTIAPLLR